MKTLCRLAASRQSHQAASTAVALQASFPASSSSSSSSAAGGNKQCPVSHTSSTMLVSKLLRHRSSAAAATATVSTARDEADLAEESMHTTQPSASKCPFSGRATLQSTATADHAQALSQAAAPAKNVTTKTMRDLKGPPAWPLLGNFVMYIKKENRGRLHEALMEQHKVYGDMFREKLGPSTQLHVCDPNIMEQIYRFSGKYPIRPPIMAWRRVRQDQNRAFGLVTSMDGDYWHQTRKLVNEKMLTPTSLYSYIGDINDATNQMVARLRRLRNTHGTEWLTSEVMNEFYKWSLETAGLCILESRLGCLADDMPEKASQFIAAIGDMMSSSLYVIVMDGLHKRLNTRYWQKHVDAWNRILDIARFYIDKKVKEIADGTPVREGSDSLIAHLLQSNQLSNDEIYSNITEILLAGTDTTSNTLSFTLNQLATHPRVQHKLREEIERVSRGADVTVDDLNSMPYMRATLKESMRLFPVGTMNVRVLQKDLELNGYLIPKDTLCVLNHYAASRNENMFDGANDFRPERWLPGPQTNKYPVNPFAVLPFGYGARGCVGKRLALMEMKIAMVKLLKAFDLKPVAGMELKPNLRTLLTPGTHIPVQYVDRQ